MAFSEQPDQQRAALNLPPTYEQLQAQQGRAGQGRSNNPSRLQAIGDGARGILRWFRIVRAVVAMVVGLAMTFFGIWLMVGNAPGADNNLRTNAWGILLAGLFFVGLSAWTLRRAFPGR